MRLSVLLLRLFRFLLPPALIGTVYLYLYPFWQQCAFPPAKAAFSQNPQCSADGSSAISRQQAPFRLLALADPQLEGDTSLPDPNAPLLPSLRRLLHDVERHGLGTLTTSVSEHGRRLLEEDVPTVFKMYRKRLDLWGNDLYLAHVYRSVRWYTDPTHVVVLGDLLGSQWISDEEFASRSNRFWNRVFRNGRKVDQHIMDATETRVEILGSDRSWKNRIITIAGNHDIGYSGDIDEHRIERFEDSYGRVNWDIHFSLPSNMNESDTDTNEPRQPSPSLRLLILNSMNLDGPAKNTDLLQQSVDFLDRKLHSGLLPPNAGTVLLTHIPLHKEEGICVDGPYFDYFADYHGGGVKEQNHLSYDMSARVLDGISGPERTRQAIVLNGHDHAGCHVWHSTGNELPDSAVFINGSDTELRRWSATNYHHSISKRNNNSLYGIREVTVRSMMGEFGGNAGLLSAWWDAESKEWRFEYDSCMCGVQHIWWAVHVLDIVVLGLGITGALIALLESSPRSSKLVLDSKKKV